MDPKANYYELLEVDASADADSIRASYRKLARKYHPDTNPDNPRAEAHFKRVGEAYSILSDPQKRQEYDTLIGKPKAKPQSQTQSGPDPKTADAARAAASANKSSQSRVPPRSKATATGTRQKPDAPRVDISGTGFKEIFDNLFGKDGAKKAYSEAKKSEPPKPPPQPKAAPSPPVRGQDIMVDAVLSQEEAQTGVVKTINVQHTETCRRCSGTGRLNGAVCSACKGERQSVTLRKIEVKVPAGVKSGSKVRVAKEGGKGISGGEPGDLFLLIKVEEDSRLRVDGMMVLCDLYLSVTEAVLGAEIEVPTLTGKVKMTIPPGTNSGKQFRLKGQGIPQGSARGDQLVTVQIVTPKNLSARERELYQELSRLNTDSPRS